MNTKQTFIGIIVAGLLLSTAACGGNSAPAGGTTDVVAPPATPVCTTDTDCASGQVCDAGACKEAQKPAGLSLDDIAGYWQATTYEMTCSNTGKTEELIAEGYVYNATIEKDSTVSTVFKNSKLNVFDKEDKLSLTIKDGKQLAFSKDTWDATLQGDQMVWTTDGVKCHVVITLQKGTPPPVDPNALTVDHLVGHWKLTKFEQTDIKSGVSIDMMQKGYDKDLTITQDLTKAGFIDILNTLNGQNTSEDKGTLTILDDQKMNFGTAQDYEVKITDPTMTWKELKPKKVGPYLIIEQYTWERIP